MPEGPEIRRARDELANLLEDEVVDELFFAFESLYPFQSSLEKQRIVAVESKGKAILVKFENELAIYSHNQLYGRWYLSPDRQMPEVNRQLRLALHVSRGSAFLYSASDISVLKTHELATHPYLRKLGLELLAPETTSQQVHARLVSHRNSRRCLMALLQDQTILAGMGNYLCCEILHVCGLHPETRLSDLNDKQLATLAWHCWHLTRQSYETGGVTNLLSRSETMQQQGITFEDYRFNVYRRAGQPCYQCDTPIVKDKFCSRMGYYCPGCQSRK